MDTLTLRIATPNGILPDVECDSIQLTVCDNNKGVGGGSYGIKKGHIECLLSLDEGKIRASANGNTLISGKTSGGFATVKNNLVTAVVENFIKE